MTEEHWIQNPDWEDHFALFGNRLSQRKQRLLASGFCRLLWRAIEDSVVREAIETAERSVDGWATVAELENVRKRCRELATQCDSIGAGREDRVFEDARHEPYRRRDLAWLGAFITAGQFQVKEISERTYQFFMSAVQNNVMHTIYSEEDITRRPSGNLSSVHTNKQNHIYRDLIGNPFREVSFEPTWRTATVQAIAVPMLETGDFSTLPILADALEDAGCEVPQVLDHCRGPGPHYRGCWVVDGVLGKG